MRNRYRKISLAILWLAFATGALFCGEAIAQTFDEQFEHWPTKLKIDGRIVVNCSDGPTGFAELAELYEDKKVVCLQLSDEKISLPDAFRDRGAKPKVIGVESLGSGDELSNDLSDAEILYIGPSTLAGFQNAKRLLPEIGTFLSADKTIVVDSSVAPWFGRSFSVFSNGDNKEVERLEIRTGFNLIPDCCLVANATKKEDGLVEQRKILRAVTGMQPRLVGVGLPRTGQLILDGRKLWVQGSGTATFLLAANDRQPIRLSTISERRRRRQAPENFLVDLTEWRRDAIDRTLPVFPPEKPPIPKVDNGTLFIVGGGGMPRGLMSEFVKAAGGEKAKLVYVPCSERDEIRGPQRTVESWKKMGVVSATFIHTKNRNTANSDEDFMAPLKDATGIWFGGGRQWNFADSYYGTEAHRLMKEVLRRGGAIGGSSAGASIQARYLARATPIGNFKPMAPGYERGGLGFIGGVAIDQHFSQRRRQPDMTSLVNRYPQLLGIGIDEATALIVKKSIGKVVGRGKVHFYDRTQPVYPDRPDFVALAAGESYDLAKREVVSEAEDESDLPVATTSILRNSGK